MAIKTPEALEAAIARTAENARRIHEAAQSVNSAQNGTDAAEQPRVMPLVSPSTLGKR